MYTDMFKSFSEQLQGFTNPVMRYNQILAANMEKLAKLQLESTTAYTELSISRMQALADTKDPQSAAQFGAGQLETLAKVSNRMLEDIQALTQIGTSFKDEVDTLIAESTKAATQKAG